jgi:hypothetical protein
MFIHFSTASMRKAVIASSPISSAYYKVASAKRRRLRIGLIAATAATALSFSVEPIGKQARSETGATRDKTARPATPQPGPIPEAGPLAQPKSLDQVGLESRAVGRHRRGGHQIQTSASDRHRRRRRNRHQPDCRQLRRLPPHCHERPDQGPGIDIGWTNCASMQQSGLGLWSAMYGDHEAPLSRFTCDEIMRSELGRWFRQRLSNHWRLLPWPAHLC